MTHLAFTSHHLLIVRPAGQVIVVGIEDSKQVWTIKTWPKHVLSYISRYGHVRSVAFKYCHAPLKL